MKKFVFYLCLLFSGIASAQVPTTIPKTPTDPIEEPPRPKLYPNRGGLHNGGMSDRSNRVAIAVHTPSDWPICLQAFVCAPIRI